MKHFTCLRTRSRQRLVNHHHHHDPLVFTIWLTNKSIWLNDIDQVLRQSVKIVNIWYLGKCVALSTTFHLTFSRCLDIFWQVLVVTSKSRVWNSAEQFAVGWNVFFVPQLCWMSVISYGAEAGVEIWDLIWCGTNLIEIVCHSSR